MILGGGGGGGGKRGERGEEGEGVYGGPIMIIYIHLYVQTCVSIEKKRSSVLNTFGKYRRFEHIRAELYCCIFLDHKF